MALLKAKVAGFLQLGGRGGGRRGCGVHASPSGVFGYYTTSFKTTHVFDGLREDDLHFPAAASQIIAMYGVLCRENRRTTASLAYKHISANVHFRKTDVFTRLWGSNEKMPARIMGCTRCTVLQ